MIEHYESEWLEPGLDLYDLCVNSSIGLDAAVPLIDANLMFVEENCTATAQKEFLPCHAPEQL